MIVNIHNDGKGKHGSFEVGCDEIKVRTAYGATEADALKKFGRLLREHRDEAILASDAFARGAFEKQEVDGYGFSAAYKEESVE